MPNKIQIVLLTDCFESLAGGAERQIFELVRRLDKTKFCVTMASLDCQGKAPKALFESNGCRLFVFKVKRIYGLSGLIQGIRFLKFLKNEKVDIVQTYHFSSDIWGAFWGRLAGVRIIISNRRDTGFWRSKKHIGAYKTVNRWVKKIVTNSSAGKDMVVREEGVSEDKIEVIYNGVELPIVSHPLPAASKRGELEISDRDLVISHVASLKPIKGHRYLFEAVSGIISQFRNIKLLLIGEDKLNGELQTLAQKVGISENIFFLGKRNDVSQLLAISDICVLPSLSEGLSNAILEYMSAGKAVVATKVGGNLELIRDGFNGILVEKENVESLKDSLLDLINNPSKRQTMGQKGLEIVKNKFSMQGMVEKYERLFVEELSHIRAPQSPRDPVRQGEGRIKILYLISSSGLFGAENIVLSLTRHFNKNGITSIVGALNDKRNPHLEIIERAKERNVDTCVVESRGKVDFAAIIRLKEYISKNNIDILHTHNYKSDVIGLMASWLTGVPIVATAHGFTDVSRSVTVYERMDRCILKHFFRRVIVVSDKILPGMTLQRRRIIPNGLDVSRFAVNPESRNNFRRQWGIGEDEIVVGTVGRLSKEKNQGLFLDAASRLIKMHERLRLLIVGDGPEAENLKLKTESLNLNDKVIFTGILTDIPSAYQAMDIFTLTSNTEGIPLSILEAMASRVSVIATNVGGIPDIIKDNETGMLIEPENSQELADRLDLLIKDHELRKVFAQAGYQFVRNQFSQEKMLKGYREVYEEILT